MTGHINNEWIDIVILNVQDNNNSDNADKEISFSLSSSLSFLLEKQITKGYVCVSQIYFEMRFVGFLSDLLS